MTWTSGTILGALGGGALGDTDRLGLDAIYPAFFVGLLISEARSGRARGAAAIGALIALALVPFAPAGVPVLAASLGALLGLSQRAQAEAAGGAGMSTSVILIAGCAIVTAAIKAAGPVLLGGRELPARFLGVVSLLAPALLAALVVTQTLAEGKELAVGDQTAGVPAGGLSLAHRLDHRLRRRRRRGHRRPARALTLEPRGGSGTKPLGARRSPRSPGAGTSTLQVVLPRRG